MKLRSFLLSAGITAFVASPAFWGDLAHAQSAGAVAPASSSDAGPEAAPTATPIKHLVVIFQENVSFDHYFATYPKATNPPREPAFTAAPDTPKVDNLATANLLLSNNPNFTNKENGSNAAEPFRLDRTQANTADQNHAYTAEQQAYDGGKADLFPNTPAREHRAGSAPLAPRGR